MRKAVSELAVRNGADIVGFAPASRFSNDSPIFRLMPDVKTVIGMAFRVLRGIYRGIEEGSTYYQYVTMAVENMEETIMPMALLRVSNLIEARGYVALPQRKSQLILAEKAGTNPEVLYDMIYTDKPQETAFDFTDAAVKCGLGEKGLHGALLTDEFGPFVRCVFILTDAEFEYTPIKQPHLCDNCGSCIKACHGGAISDTGVVDNWQCSVYYKGANGRKNPFMPPDAFSQLEDRIAIIAGEAKVTPETAKKILDNIYFYPPASHGYQSSVCGRACDIACYCHLEEKGVLEKKYNKPFRRREEWNFDIGDYE